MSTSDISTVISLIAGLTILMWRLGVTERLTKLVNVKVKEAVEKALFPLRDDLRRHTLQIEGLHRDNTTNKHRIVQIVWAGANAVTSAAIWAKTPPSQRELNVAISDYRRILGEDDLDAS